MAQTLSVLVENKSGVLARIAGVFSARGFNIESLTVARTPDPLLSRITMVVDVEDRVREQVLKQLNKQVNVVQVLDFSRMPSVQRELALIKVHLPHEQRSRLLQEAEIFRARVVDTHPASITLEVTGGGEKLKALVQVLEHYGRVDMVRSGAVALPRGAVLSKNGAAKTSAAAAEK